MHTKFLIKLAFIACLLASSAQALNAAYIYHSLVNVDQNIVAAVQALGYPVVMLQDSTINSGTSFSSYAFIIVDDEFYTNSSAIPVNKVPTLIMNTNYLFQWGWSNTISSIASSTPLNTTVANSSHQISQGLPASFSVYTSCCDGSANLQMYYL